MSESLQQEPLLPDLLAARLMEMRRQQASALQATEATLVWLGVLPAERRLLLTRAERARLRAWVREMGGKGAGG